MKSKLEPYNNTMPKKPKPKGKMVKGKNYADADEEYGKKKLNKEEKSLSTAGLQALFKKSQKEKGYSKIPRVQPVKKGK